MYRSSERGLRHKLGDHGTGYLRAPAGAVRPAPCDASDTVPVRWRPDEAT